MVAASVFWSLGGVCIKFIPWTAMSIISSRAMLAALTFAIFRKGFKINLTKSNCLAAVCLSGTTIMFVFANQLTTAAAAIVLQFTSPVFVLLLQFVFYKRRPRFGEVLAVAFTLIGMVLFFADELSEGNRLGNVLAIGSGLAFAGVVVFNKRPDAEPEHSIMLGFYINAVIWSPFLFMDPGITATLLPWSLIILMGIVQVGLAYVFFSIGIQRTPALLVCLITALEPILNPLWVALATPERPGRFALLGGAVIILTIIVFNIWVEKSGALRIEN